MKCNQCKGSGPCAWCAAAKALMREEFQNMTVHEREYLLRGMCRTCLEFTGPDCTCTRDD